MLCCNASPKDFKRTVSCSRQFYPSADERRQKNSGKNGNDSKHTDHFDQRKGGLRLTLRSRIADGWDRVHFISAGHLNRDRAQRSICGRSDYGR
jgi:hypothetical protein